MVSIAAQETYDEWESEDRVRRERGAEEVWCDIFITRTRKRVAVRLFIRSFREGRLFASRDKRYTAQLQCTGHV
jgi:hypothetical protein